MIKTLTFALSLMLGLAACSGSETTTAPDKTADSAITHIVLGSIGADAQVWRFIASTPAAKAAGLSIEVKEINDGISLNAATAEQRIDVNAFQSWAYLKTYNKNNGDRLRAIATTYLEPMGLYSTKYPDLASLPDGALVSIPNDTANTARALLLLAQAGLLTLAPDFDAVTGTPQDIVSNPKKLVIRLIQGASGPRVLGDVDLAAIGNTVALEGGLNVIKDALAYEQVNERTLNNINILVTSKDRANDAILLKLGDLYHQDSVTAYVEAHFGGTKLAVNQAITTLN